MTAQVPEDLIYCGVVMAMASCPELPVGHPRLVLVPEHELDRKEIDPIILSTACWRQYIGTWEIREGCLYLVNLRGRWKLQGSDPLFADWFSGMLRIPQGALLEYVHMGFGSVFEQELHLKVERGLVTAEQRVDNRGRKFDRKDAVWRDVGGIENRFPGSDDRSPRRG
jgi:hypothetical protein